MEGGGILLIGKEDLLQMRGLMPESYGGIHFPSTFAAETLLYCTRFGYYVCNEDYCIVRERRNGYGLYYVAEGTMELKTLGQRLIAKEGNLIFLTESIPMYSTAWIRWHIMAYTSTARCSAPITT